VGHQGFPAFLPAPRQSATLPPIPSARPFSRRPRRRRPRRCMPRLPPTSRARGVPSLPWPVVSEPSLRQCTGAGEEGPAHRPCRGFELPEDGGPRPSATAPCLAHGLRRVASPPFGPRDGATRRISGRFGREAMRYGLAACPVGAGEGRCQSDGVRHKTGWPGGHGGVRARAGRRQARARSAPPTPEWLRPPLPRPPRLAVLTHGVLHPLLMRWGASACPVSCLARSSLAHRTNAALRLLLAVSSRPLCRAAPAPVPPQRTGGRATAGADPLAELACAMLARPVRPERQCQHPRPLATEASQGPAGSGRAGGAFRLAAGAGRIWGRVLVLPVRA
jgi:hypothetical protein